MASATLPLPLPGGRATGPRIEAETAPLHSASPIEQRYLPVETRTVPADTSTLHLATIAIRPPSRTFG